MLRLIYHSYLIKRPIITIRPEYKIVYNDFSTSMAGTHRFFYLSFSYVELYKAPNMNPSTYLTNLV